MSTMQNSLGMCPPHWARATTPSNPWTRLNAWSANDDDVDIFKTFRDLKPSDLCDTKYTQQGSPEHPVSSSLPMMDCVPKTLDVFPPMPGDPNLRQKRTSLSSSGSSTGSTERRTITLTVGGCCNSTDFRVICNCCGDEVHPTHYHSTKESQKEQSITTRPRVIPVATSQLGFCRFCQVNGEPPEVVRSHGLRSDDGKVTCPTLREYNCPICMNGGGDYAHTIKYCPMARNRHNAKSPYVR